MKKIILSSYLVIVLLLAATVTAFGQGTTSRVTGIISDSSGAAIAGASVTLTNESTGVSLTATTNDGGAYTFDLIQAGTYRISVEKQGFKKFVSSGNTVNVNVPATINLKLEVGDLTAVMNVESLVEQVQTSSSGNIGATIEQKTQLLSNLIK